MNDLIGRLIRVRFEDTDHDFFYIITDVIENSDSILVFKDKHHNVKGINKKYIKEIS